MSSRKNKKPGRRTPGIEREIERRVRKELKRNIALALIHVLGTNINHLIRFGWFPAVAWAAAWAWVRSAPDVAGQETRVELVIGGVFKLFANRWIYLLVVFFTLAGWGVDRKVMKRRLAQMAGQKKKLETLIDTNRSSSGLNKHAAHPND